MRAACCYAGPHARHHIARRWLSCALALLLGIQPVTTDLYLPALPQLARDLRRADAAAQLTHVGVDAAFGVAQLLWGPVADRFGRRPVLLAGLALYVAASIASAARADDRAG